MANITFKKKLIIFIFISLCSFQSFSQKTPVTSFSKDFPVFMSELQSFMTASNNSELKLTYKKFNKLSESFTVAQQLAVIEIANQMIQERLKPKPHFNNFFNSLLIVSSQSKEDALFLQWLDVADQILKRRTVKKLFDFCIFSNNLFNDKVLHSTRSAKWIVNSDDFRFSFEDVDPVVIYSSNIDLTCSNSRGEINIFDTKGAYYPLLNKWIGSEGIIYWDKHGLSSDMVFAQTSNYKLDTRKSEIVADSSIFYNKNLFNKPIVGELVNKITSGKQSDRFPCFTSYSKNIELKNIFDNVDYKGGYKLVGKDFVADGGDYNEARIIFKKDGKELFIANANRFNIGDNKITSESVGIRMFLAKDSLFHSNLSFKYFDNKRQLQLYRKRNSASGSPMLNTYHNLTMDFELLKWNIDSDIITLGSLKGTAESIVRFESIDMYRESRFIDIQGIDAVHPLILINKYVEEKQEETFYMEDFAKYVRFPGHQIKPYLLKLASYGFIFYDFAEEKVTVQPMLYTYIDAASGLGDYDVISFHSKALGSDKGAIIDENIVNAIIKISTKDLIISGIYNVKLSDTRKVKVLPDRGVITVKKNRDFIFNGQIFAGGGRLNLFGKDFYFHYDDFMIDLESIDSVGLAIPWPNASGEEELVGVNTVFEYVQDGEKPQGELRIDHPTNKSGLSKDSFPEFPIFTSKQKSYAYYDNSYSVYNRDRFFFHLDSYEIDSLESFKAKGLWFAGSFSSAGIFPTFQDTLRVQDDISFGFKRKTPIDGFPIYSGAARFYDNIYLSNGGLEGDGLLEYRNTRAFANKINWFPDSTNLHTDTLSISEVNTGIEFPQVYNTETYVHFVPHQQKMDVSMKERAFNFYQDQATFEGDLLMQPAGLTGGGVMKLDKAEVEATDFTYNANWFGSESADLKILAEEEEIAVLGNDLRTHIDLKLRQGIFNANESSTSSFNLISNQYMCYIDKAIWDMDAASFVLGDTVSSDYAGSKFVSTHPEQESLSFFAKTAEYSLKDYVIHANGVESIVVADAVIHPDSGIVRIHNDAKMEKLLNATIDLTQSSSHVFTSANVDIKSSIDYTASGEYTLHYGGNNTKQILFHNIEVNSDKITQAYANLDDDKPFSINSKLDLKGKVELYANVKDLTFNGYFMLNHSCNLLKKEWVSFRSSIDPENITIVLNDSIFNDNNDKLYVGVMMRKDTIGVYSTFFNKKKNVFDLEVIQSTYSLTFDKKGSQFTVHGRDSLSDLVVLSENTCKINAEGEIDLNINLGKVKVRTIGSIENDIKNEATVVDGFVLIDFFFSDKAMEAMACDIAGDVGKFENCNIEPIGYSDYDELFVKNLRRIVKDQDYVNRVIEGLETSKRKSFPKELDYTLAFTKVSLNWDKQNRAFVSNGDIGLGNINSYSIDEEEMDGLVVFEKKQGGSNDVLFIDLKTPAGEIYLFKYQRGEMRAFSYNEYFKNSIIDISSSNRRLDGRPRYNYAFPNGEEWSEKQRKEYEKRY